ncbi:ribokinase [Leucobacter musarum]|uniref:ribokinase n=1 Tax=Leucobacter musarum TaxID=1930747 RepID=UPI0006A76C38|nr:ribokinase [Leucobacter musarum]
MPRRPQLAVLGSINIDLIAQTESLPRPGETIGGGTFSRLPGGKGANQAVAASRLGAQVRMVGVVGDDGEGALARVALEAAGVSLDAVRRGAQPTGVALIGVDAAGENQISVCPGANGEVGAADVVFSDGEAVLVQLEVPMAAVVAAARSCTGFFAVNAAPAADLPDEVIERADLVIVNESEFAAIPALHTADALVAVSLGADGARLLRGGVEIARSTSHAAEVRSTVGAGDAFCAGLVVALVSGVAPDAALAAACAVGAAAVADVRSQPELSPLNAYLG